MSMSTSIRGFKPPDEKWKRMREVWRTCEKANVPIPKEVEIFFDYGEPDESGVVIDLEENDAVELWETESESGFQVDLTKLPKDVRFIRFYNSW
jgi:hypothetical protein